MQIRLQHTGCFGRCPVYGFLFSRNDTSVYEGGPFAIIQGRYETIVDSSTFERLAQLLLDSHFFALDSVLSPMWSDSPSIQLSAVLADSRKKWVIAQALPASFLRLTDAIDSVGSHLQWRPKAP